jgi:hypothetical protein
VETKLIIRRRQIGEAELRLIRQLIAEEGQKGRSHLSNRLCQIWDWRQANGRFRQIACRDLLRKLQAKGLIELPPMLHAARRAGYRNVVPGADLFDRLPLRGPLGPLRTQSLLSLVEGPEQARLFNGLIGTYHYLGYQQPTGAQLKYLAWYQGRPIGCLSFGPAAFKIAARDEFIGWPPSARQERLDWLVNNERFLILPWIEVPHLGSFLLSRCLRRLRHDWQRVYGHDLALVETFIEKDRFRGCSYAAANWICVGQTGGRGRNDRLHQKALPVKSVWLYALRKDFRQVLCP